ncbi:MAG: DNA adenine methylase [Clostridiales bacterium]|nr:DNA adenine methylase [Clostridiales bacterium]
MLRINNRRYIGNKTKLLEQLSESIPNTFIPEQTVFADLFAGTGAVASYFAEKGFNVIVNDILYSNFVAYNAWLSDLPFDECKIVKILDLLNSIDYNAIEPNYFSEIYSNKYFSFNDAKKIGYTRDYIESIRNSITEREYFILLSSLLYATDRIANTVGHFEYFLKKVPQDTFFKLENLEIKNIKHARLFNTDANCLAKQIRADIVYIDPPYNARQYINFYHVLENLARWQKPREFEGNSMKFKRNELKSGYSRAEAPQLFESLIESLDSKLILVSYSNTYSAKSIASNNKISEEQIIGILSRRGTVTKREIDYDYFNAGKTNLEGHKELIFICEVCQ